MRRLQRMVALGAALGIAAACREERAPVVGGGLPGDATSVVRTGGFAAGPAADAPVMRNPLAGNEQAMAEGRRLYVWYNCAGCHGMEGGGGMGPPFADDAWIYGGEPNNVYQSIVQGRPNGMPAYERLSDDHVWKLVLRVRDLGGLDEPTPRPGQGGTQEGRGGQ